MRKRSLIFALAFVLLLLCGCTSSVYPEETDTGMQTVKNGMIRLWPHKIRGEGHKKAAVLPPLKHKGEV